MSFLQHLSERPASQSRLSANTLSSLPRSPGGLKFPVAPERQAIALGQAADLYRVASLSIDSGEEGLAHSAAATDNEGGSGLLLTHGCG